MVQLDPQSILVAIDCNYGKTTNGGIRKSYQTISVIRNGVPLSMGLESHKS